jgi:hypothetical protein
MTSGSLNYMKTLSNKNIELSYSRWRQIAKMDDYRSARAKGRSYRQIFSSRRIE